MDSVQKLFEAFPDPDSNYCIDNASVTSKISQALRQFVKDPPSKDPDYEYLLFHAKRSFEMRCGPVPYFRQQLAYLTVRKPPPNRKDKSVKARQFKYHRWMAQGKKGETYPFKGTAFKPCIVPSTARMAMFVTPTDCEYCHKEGANMLCPSCNFSDSEFVVCKSKYCNKKCLEADAGAHKRLCDERKMVYRATQLLNFIFTAVQEATFMWPVQKVYFAGDVACFAAHDWDRACMTGRPIFYPFPKNLTDKPDLRRALMYWGQAEEVCLSLYPLIINLFNSWCDIAVAKCYPISVCRPLCQVFSDRALKVDGPYALDLTAAQFGWKEILTPWLPWNGFRIENVSFSPFKHIHANHETMILKNDLEHFQLDVRGKVHRSIINEIAKIVADYPYDSFGKVLKAPAEEYRLIERDFKDMVKQRVFVMIKNEYHKSSYRIWADLGAPNPDVHIAHKKAEVLKKIWLSKKEYDRLKKEGADLDKIWVERAQGKLEKETT
ncbi:hypothetical protein F5Y10DRAFT_287221 [Nemania abortiva]|nr:hypothetical protein F5Y10DRAFT_287221 [Nemania abortiva]